MNAAAEQMEQYRGYWLSQDRWGTWAIYMTGENQPIQTALPRETAIGWIDRKYAAARRLIPA